MDNLGRSGPRTAGDGQEFGARTIPASPRAQVGFSVALLLASVAASACAGPVENSILRSERQREIERLELQRDGQQRDTQLLTLTIQEDELALRALRDEAADLAARRRAAARSVASETQQLAVAEQERAAVQAELVTVARDLEALRAAIAEVATKELRLRALKAESADLDAQLAAAQQELSGKSLEQGAKLASLRETLAKLGAIEAQWAAVLPPPNAPAVVAVPNSGTVPTPTDSGKQ
ncbi:MAG: hypothetical protein ABL997_00745 [Planctomycetota bacterium]